MAITVTSRTDSVFGDRRVITLRLTIGADADTYVTGLSLIDSVHATSATNSAIGATVSGGTVTFQTGGAEAGAYATIVGL